MKGAGHADMYDPPINFIKGHNPDLVIFDDESGEETERIKLNELTVDEMHALVKSKGIKLKEIDVGEAGTCENPDGCDGGASSASEAPPVEA